VFRRRRREDAEPGYDSAQDDPGLHGDQDQLDELDEQNEPDDFDEPDEPDDLDDDEDFDAAGGAENGTEGHAEDWDQRSGPWDGAGSYPQRDRLDFGSMLVPAYEGIEVEVKIADAVPVWITVRRGDSSIELMAFAAPKTSGLWEEVRQEFADEVANAGGDSREAHGPFGIELHARLHPGGEGRRGQLEPVRFLGVDGPRWFLRGMIRGPAASHPRLAGPLEELFADVVVVRGEHPAPPGDLLEIRLPQDAQQALDEQLAQEQAGPGYLSPFERGPEITETR
jgi:hypothetical protein